MRSGRGSPFAIILESCGTDAIGARSVACGRTHEVPPAVSTVAALTRAVERFAHALHIPLNLRRDAWLAHEPRASLPANQIPCYDWTRRFRLTGPRIHETLFPHYTRARGPPRPRRAKHLL